MNDTTRPAHRAGAPNLVLEFIDVSYALCGRQRPVGRHVAPSFEVRLEQYLRPHGYSVPRLLAALDASQGGVVR